MQKKKAPQIIEDREGQTTHTEQGCQKCQKTGNSTSTFTKIENFKEVIVVEFNCKDCGFSNSYVDFVEKKNEFGIEIMYKLQHTDDKLREVVHSEHAIIAIEQLKFTALNTSKSQITTIKGLIERVVEELNQKKKAKEQATQIEGQELDKEKTAQILLEKAKNALEGNLLPLTIRIRDPSGNSNIKNLNYPLPDKNIQIYYFERSVEQLMAMGFTKQEAQEEVKLTEERKKGIKLNFNKPFEEKDFMHKEPVVFQVPCHTCMMPGEMKLCETSVPYFTDLIIMSFTCEYCGAHSVETKNNGEVSEEALQITLKVDSNDDLKRDLFKSETCKVTIPELELELDYGTLGGQYTTIEGLLQKIYEHLSGRNQFCDVDGEFSDRMKTFLSDLMAMKNGQKPFTITFIDPMSSSFLQNPYHPQEDKKAKRISRPRNEDQNDFLGFEGMNVDNYK